MMDSFYIGAYWGSRAESLSHVRDRILQTLQKLAEIDMQFSNWYELGLSRKKALEKSVIFNNETVEKLCLQKVKKGELDENGFAKWGFIFGLWSGHAEEESSNINFSVGTGFTSPHLNNSCVITIPFEGAGRERLLKLEKAKRIIATLIEIWKPDYSVLTSESLRNKLDAGNKIGWITYQNAVKHAPTASSKVIHEKGNVGHWFYLDSDNLFNESLVNELLSIKHVIT